MSHPGRAESAQSITLLSWVASNKESRIHLTDENADAEPGAKSKVAICDHTVTDLCGTWSGRPPDITGYLVCEPCLIAADLALHSSGPRVRLGQWLYRNVADDAHGKHPTSDDEVPGKHAVDRPTTVIPTIEASRPGEVDDPPTVRLPKLHHGLQATEWPADDPDERTGSEFGVPGSPYLPGTMTDLTQLSDRTYRPRHALGVAA